MNNTPDIWQFLEENKKMIQEYVELKIEIFNLKFIRKSSSIGGILIWIMILAFSGLLILFFAGITLGFWLSKVFESNIAGFGATTGILLLITLILVLARKQLFINPIIRIIIREQTKENEEA
ncbi:MAG: hypothetical protein NTZ19_04965 [Bacteroidetes bacterium]|nr:hypothetical protein [Bacteroidota bacterium]